MSKKDNPHKEYLRGAGESSPYKIKKVDFAPMGAVLSYNEGLAKREDLWKHKSTGMRCHTCMYFVTKEKTLGRCRRHAPTMSGFPAVYELDWCGDHKLEKDVSA